MEEEVMGCSRCMQKEDVCDGESCRCRCHPWSRLPKEPPSPEHLAQLREWHRQHGISIHRALLSALRPLPPKMLKLLSTKMRRELDSLKLQEKKR